MDVRAHLEIFRQGAPDEEWLPEVGRRGWVLITLDTRLRYNRLEQQAIREHKVPAFVLVGGKSHEEKADVFLAARARVEKLLEKNRPPFIAKVYAGGRVALWLGFDE